MSGGSTLALTIALTALVHGPGSAQAWVPVMPEPAVTNAATVVGDIELSRGEAVHGAITAARDMRLGRLRERGQELAERFAPFWLPSFAMQGEVDEWVARVERKSPLAVAREETEVFNYSYGEAFRTTLHVDNGMNIDHDSERQMQQGIQQLARLLMTKVGGIAFFWGLLAFLSAWFDRLTRGYMSWRLRFMAVSLGIVVPAVVLLM